MGPRPTLLSPPLLLVQADAIPLQFAHLRCAAAVILFFFLFCFVLRGDSVIWK